MGLSQEDQSQPPGHLAWLTTNPEQGRLLTVQQDSRDSKFGTFNNLAPMTTAWLPVIISLILSNCTSLSPLHCTLHQRPPQPTIWIEWRQDPPCGEASVGVKVWASYAYLEGGVQQLTQSTATLGAAPTADSMPQFRTIPAQISMMSGAQELATWFGFGLNQMAPQQLH